MTLINDGQKIGGEIIQETERPRPGSASVKVTGIILNARTITQFADHFQVILDTLLDPLGLQRLAILLKKIDLLLNVQYPGMNCEVPDPYYGDTDGFHKTFDIIDKALDVLIEKYEK